MAPSSKTQPKHARSASGHSKKQPHPAPAATTATAAVAPTNRQYVVPAIPLAYMSKQSGNTRNATTKSDPKHAPIASTSSNGFLVSSLEAALITPDSPGSTKNSKNEVQGQNVEKPTATISSPQRTEHQPRLSALQVNGIGHTDTVPTSDGGSRVPNESQDGSPHNLTSLQSPKEVSPDSHLIGANGGLPYASQPESATSATQMEPAPSLPALSHAPPHQHHMADQHHPAVFRAPPPHPMHLHQHRHQISNGGGIMFGGFGSHSPSPVPLPGGFMPPPHPVNGENRGHPLPNSHHHNHSNGNGFPAAINTHFRGDVVTMSPMDAYGPVLTPTPPAHMEAYAPGTGRYGPSTPHSFHGSHASGELNGTENGALPCPPNGPYAPNARREHHASHPHPSGPFPPFMPPQPISRQVSVAEDEIMEVMEGVHYIRSLFDNRELADCLLELISTKGLHHPIKISGHKLILARSPTLKQRIMAARVMDQGFQTITMEVDDPYLRSDAWWMAIQRLYQHPLFQLPPIPGNAGHSLNFAGNTADRFGFCLGYAAAGSVLSMPDVFIRGLHIAASALSWETVEAGLAFVLENTVQRHFGHTAELEEALPSTVLEFGYGPETKILLSAILNFLITEFPANFKLDTSAPDDLKIARIPISAVTTTITPTRAHVIDEVAPTIARGTTTHQHMKQARLSSIKFGDLPPAYPDDGAVPRREPAKCSPILSRILLNLPFDELCRVLTSGSNGVPGWNTAQDRYHAVADVVAEREARRLRAVDAVRSEVVPNAYKIQARLSVQHRYTTAEQWDVLNWQEEVIRDETPRIIRKWVPQFDVEQEPTQQRALPRYEIPDSMV